MRYCVVILTSILLLFSPRMTMAEDVLLGTVISADEQSGKLVLRLIGGNAEDIAVTMDKNVQPDHIEVGTIVRIWGNYLKTEPLMFRGTKVSSERFRYSDPTGVRSRLQMGADKMTPPPRGPR